MSELQAALLVIGAGAVVAVYVFGWWQQRKYRGKFGAAFKADHADALYRETAVAPVGATPQTAADEAVAEETVAAVDGAVAPGAEQPDRRPPDDACALLDARSDFIVELHLEEPGPAAVLDGLWQRKFDFGKPVHICGLTLAGQRWERAIAESQTLYSRFRIALQLVDRGGAISAAKLADFRDLALDIAERIKADAAAPDIGDTHRRAVDLDTFCAGVDQMVGINLMPPGERLLSGAKIAQAAAPLGLTLESDGAFHLLDARGHSAFSLTGQDGKPFQHHLLETFSTPGLALLLDVPRTEDPAAQFDGMVRAARELSRELQVNMVDDRRAVLSDGGLARSRAQIAAIEAEMRDNGIEPGGGLARRLFA